MAQTHACKEFEQDLVLYHYGECVPADKQHVESHLETCGACRGFLQGLKTFLPSTLAVDEPPPSFWQDYSREMRIKLSELEEKRGWWPSITALFRPWPVPALAAAAILAIGITMTMNRSSDAPSNPNSGGEYAYMASHADFFKSMDLLDSMDFLESVEASEAPQGESTSKHL